MKDTTKVGILSATVTLALAGLGFGIALDQVQSQPKPNTITLYKYNDIYIDQKIKDEYFPKETVNIDWAFTPTKTSNFPSKMDARDSMTPYQAEIKGEIND